ncbi:RNA 2',3'-cyclic phosphodiesterase [Candidatus Micrarchaeota archaeon]|nr:RNA 2',3'-cyclic phosphodiesterase [Candidatus Micrarchaeota archaeon]
MRLFIALGIPKRISEKLFEAEADLPTRGPRGVSYSDMHITLKFLGEVSEGGAVEWIKSRLSKIRFSRFVARVRGVGTFPQGNCPRVVWAGVEGAPLNALAKKVEGALSERFPTDGKAFSAHISLARADGRINVQSFLDKHRGEEFGEFEVGELLLIRSVLGPEGTKYSAIARFPAEE